MKESAQDPRLQRLSLLTQMSDQQDRADMGQQGSMMDMIIKLYGINKEQTLLPAELNQANMSSYAEAQRGNYYGAEASNLPGKTEAMQDRSAQNLMNAIYLGKTLGLAPQQIMGLVRGDPSVLADLGSGLPSSTKPPGDLSDPYNLQNNPSMPVFPSVTGMAYPSPYDNPNANIPVQPAPGIVPPSRNKPIYAR